MASSTTGKKETASASFFLRHLPGLVSKRLTRRTGSASKRKESSGLYRFATVGTAEMKMVFFSHSQTGRRGTANGPHTQLAS